MNSLTHVCHMTVSNLLWYVPTRARARARAHVLLSFDWLASSHSAVNSNFGSQESAYVPAPLSFDWLAPARFRGKCSCFGNQELCARKLLPTMNVSVFHACAFVSSSSPSVSHMYAVQCCQFYASKHQHAVRCPDPHTKLKSWRGAWNDVLG